MAPYKTRCPKCDRKLILPKSGGHVRCPKCGHRFVIQGTATSYPVAAAAAPASLIAATAPAGDHATQAGPLPIAPEFDSAARLSAAEETLAVEEDSWSPTGLVAIAVGAVLVLGLGVWLIQFCLHSPTTPGVPASEPLVELSPPAAAPAVQPVPVAAAAAPVVVLASAKTDSAPAPLLPAKLSPLTGAVKPIIVNHAGVDQAKIDAAIERGAAFLAKSYQQEGRVGAQALAGLTLLHCGKATNDPAVVDIAATVRKRAPTLSETYELALCVMFLDRLGDAADRPLIGAIALQLIAGQGVMGGWNYRCPTLNDAQRQQMLSMLASRVSTPERATDKQFSLPTFGGRTALMPANLAELPVFQYRPGTPLQLKPHGHEDNSLTQFAILALWAAQKHGIPAERSLAFAEARFRSSQGPDGTWGYMWTQNRHHNDSMTCAGLLGLAVGRGTRAASKDAKLQQGDPAIDKALGYVGQRIDILEKNAGKGGKFVGASTWGDLYYLWTLERAAVAYDLQTIGGKDWYAWGAPLIVAQQKADGQWSEVHNPIPDTCFALLFLKRANVAVDLTVRLQELALSKHIGERRGDDPERRGFDPFDRRPDLDASQREAAGYSRGRMGER
jgi:DNA-directed RNA polymerase subunit RPC12/RpoP